MKKLRRLWKALKRWLIFRLINVWPPFFGAGIHVIRLDPSAGVAEVRMKLRWWNRNYVGTQYGGSLYSMCDPFLMLILMERLGPRFVVWDKAATIRFRKPGRGTVRARFEVSAEEIEAIRAEAIREGKAERTFRVQVIDEEDQTIAEVEKQIHVKKKRKKGRSSVR